MNDNARKSLIELAEETGRDIPVEKSEHYLSFYETHFGHWRDEPLNIVDLGILNGGSAILFPRYFTNAQIVCIDIKKPPKKLYETLGHYGVTDRVHVAIGSQDDAAFLEQACTHQFGDAGADLIIDDASHMYQYTKPCFEHLFYKRLKAGGWYLVEDWGCGYWPAWPDGDPDGQHGLPRFVKEMVDLLALFDRTKEFRGQRAIPADAPRYSPIEQILLVPGILAMRKALPKE